MYAFKINGGKKLSGTVEIKGAKNAVLPIMAAALLTDQPVILNNVSPLSDVCVMTQLLKSFGATVQEQDDTLTIAANAVNNTVAIYDFVSKMRASFWVLGPLLARFGHATVSLPGGCTIGARPVDIYLKALEEMGAHIKIENGYVVAHGPLHAADIFFRRVSVGATHNTLMAAVLTPGTTVIHNAAMEPEVLDLIEALKKMGANIHWKEPKVLSVTGVSRLGGVTHTVVSDRIETASFIVAAAVTKGRLFLKGGRLDLIEAITDVIKKSGIVFTPHADGFDVDATNATLTAVPVTTSEYPGFPTDAQALITTLFSIAAGESITTENLFENRLMHIPELQRMGAHIQILNNQSVLIKGVSHLSGTTVMASDLRGGVALVLAALAARGETIVKRIYHIDRGYYQLEEKLKAVGADIERIKTPV